MVFQILVVGLAVLILMAVHKGVNKLATLQEQLDELNASFAKGSAEVVALIQKLTDQLANTTITPEAQASLDSLKAKADALDALTP